MVILFFFSFTKCLALILRSKNIKTLPLYSVCYEKKGERKGKNKEENVSFCIFRSVDPVHPVCVAHKPPPSQSLWPDHCCRREKREFMTEKKYWRHNPTPTQYLRPLETRERSQLLLRVLLSRRLRTVYEEKNKILKKFEGSEVLENTFFSHVLQYPIVKYN